MRRHRTSSPYRHLGTALLRAAVERQPTQPEHWPDPDDTAACRGWLRHVWQQPWLAEAVSHASPLLASRIEAICDGTDITAKQVRHATTAAAQYLLRAIGRPTPFGLFAGVAAVAVDRECQVHWGRRHKPFARVDTAWLADVVDQLERHDSLIDRLEVTWSNLAVRRGTHLEVPRGLTRTQISATTAVDAVRATTQNSVGVAELVSALAARFGVDPGRVRAMITGLIQHGALVTCLRAPHTVTDPLGHVLDTLASADGDTMPDVAAITRDLASIRATLDQHNNHCASGDKDGAGDGEHAMLRARVGEQMRRLSTAGRTPLAVDVVLDSEVSVPEYVLAEIEHAAGALRKLSRHPYGVPEWRDYHAAFCDRYGTGTLVPLTEAINPDTGLGYPATYPGSPHPVPQPTMTARDTTLLNLAWQALATGQREIVLTDDILGSLDDAPEPRTDPPHVELAAHIHATSTEALHNGDYTLTVTPARAGGILTARFTPTMTGAGVDSGLDDAYRALPTVVSGALPVQLSFPPAFPHAENICRVAAYLPHVLPLGEHRNPTVPDSTEEIVDLADLAVTATSTGLHLVSVARRRIVEPQVFHALALDKQPPPLARFLAQLPRAFTASWTMLAWGPVDDLACLPRVRYRRCILAPARWRLTRDDITPRSTDDAEAWRAALRSWRQRWQCPAVVDLREDDRTLRVNLDEPLHTEILRAHLTRADHVLLAEPGPSSGDGWLDGHAHEIVVPLATTRSSTPAPALATAPMVTNAAHGRGPGEPGARWLYAKIYSHPERHHDLIAGQLPALLNTVDTDGHADVDYWFVRYRSDDDPDHLRLRLRLSGHDAATSTTRALGAWAQRLRATGYASRVDLATYYPEVGRYGGLRGIAAAEEVFVADSRAVATAMRHLPANVVHPTALTALGMLDIATGLLGDDAARNWLVDHPASSGPAADRAITDQVLALATRKARKALAAWPQQLHQRWEERAAVLATYRGVLADTDLDKVVASLLHMHHNRAHGIDPDHEQLCHRLARHAALAQRARHPAGSLAGGR